MQKQVLLDTNVLVLFVVGGTNPDYIARHKNCSMFSATDYDALLLHLTVAGGLATTAHILSETANLLRQVSDPIRSEIAAFFKLYVLRSDEITVRSTDAVNDASYPFLGLNDAAILTSLRDEIVLITEDANLYAVACSRTPNALHFSQFTHAG